MPTHPVQQNPLRRWRVAAPMTAVALALLTGACAQGQSEGVQLAQAGGAPTSVRNSASPGAHRDADIQAAIQRLLAQPLSADDAVRVALLNNRSLRAMYFSVGLLDRDLSPGADGARAGTNFAIFPDVERRFVLATIGTRSRPWANEVDRRRGDSVKLEVAADMLRLAADTRRAYVGAVAAEQAARYMEQVRDAAAASTELARRMVRVGNWPKLNELREQAFLGEVTAQLARARQTATSEREHLTRLLGLWGQDAAYQLPDRLPDLPKATLDFEDLEAAAVKQRLDLQAAQIEILAEAREMELDGYDRGALLTGRTRFVDLPEVNYFADDANRADAAPRMMQVPMFDREQARLDTKMLSFMRELDRFSELAVTVRSEVRDAYAGYRTAYDIAKYYQEEVLPLRKQISDETALRYNGMLVSVFELLADAREQISSVIAAIEAQRDFWTADADLRLALATGGAERREAKSLRPSGGAKAAD